MERLFRRIGIQTTNLCQLKCDHCPVGKSNITNKLKDIEAFKEVVNIVIDSGLFRHLDVTPIVGDPFTDPTMVEKLEWLEMIPQIKKTKFITNLIGFDKETIVRVFNLKKIKPHICFFGANEEDYNEYTNTEGIFPVWEENLSTMRSIWNKDKPYTYFDLVNFRERDSKINSILRDFLVQFWENIYTTNELYEKVYGGNYIGLQILQNGDTVICGKYYRVIDNIFKLGKSFRDTVEPVMIEMREKENITGRYYSCGGKNGKRDSLLQSR